MADDLEITTGEKPLSEAAKKRVHAALKKALLEELAKEQPTIGGNDADPAVGVSGHANVGISRAQAKA